MHLTIAKLARRRRVHVCMYCQTRLPSRSCPCVLENEEWSIDVGFCCQLFRLLLPRIVDRCVVDGCFQWHRVLSRQIFRLVAVIDLSILCEQPRGAEIRVPFAIALPVSLQVGIPSSQVAGVVASSVVRCVWNLRLSFSRVTGL